MRRRPEIPPEVTPAHRLRVACIYVRSGIDPMRPEEHAEVDRQRGARRFADQWGWLPDRIVMIEDLDRCACRVEIREGFHVLMQMLLNRELGIVITSDFERLATRWEDVRLFMARCRDADTLLAIDGEIITEANAADVRMRCAYAVCARLEDELYPTLL